MAAELAGLRGDKPWSRGGNDWETQKTQDPQPWRRTKKVPEAAETKEASEKKIAKKETVARVNFRWSSCWRIGQESVKRRGC